MTISIMIMTSEGGWKCWALINSDLNFNIICQSLIKKWKINPNWESKRHPFVINEEKLFNYDIYDLEMHMYNCNEWINIYCEFFYAVEISEVNVILNYPWLHAVNSEINWKEQAWQYSINLRQIFIINSEEFTLKIKKIRQIFAVMLFSLTKADQFTQIILSGELINFQNVIATEKGLMPPLHEAAMYHIDTENQKISYKPLYNLSPHKLKVLCEYLDDALAKGWIQYNMSSVKSLILFILKKNESFQLCVNYWDLNKKMIKNHHSLLLIEKTLDCLMRFYYFMKLNLKNVYHWI